MDNQTPQTLGRYTIRAEIGRGGFATVYRALDTSLEREAALKILHPQLLTDRSFAERFRKEARALAALRHPHIVTVYEVSEAEGRLYIAMELAKGASLAQAIAERGRISWSETIALLKPVCDALDYAHAQSVVHRDLKPANILLDKERGALLTDFGFARLMGESSVSMSLSGGILGTPAYIAPEVWELEAAKPAADIYALGCIVFEMLTGQVLFAGKTPMQAMRAHDKGPQFPSAWPEGVPAGVEAVLRQALARQPEARHPSANALWQALNDLEVDTLAQREKAERAAVAAQWKAEAEAALAAGEWSAARMAVGRWLTITPDDQAAQAMRQEMDRRESEARAKAVAEQRTQREAEERQRREAERKAAQEAERKAQEDQARKEREAQEQQEREAERLRQYRAAQAAAEQKAREERERQMRAQQPQPAPAARRTIPAWTWIGGVLALLACVVCAAWIIPQMFRSPATPAPVPARTRALATAPTTGPTKPLAPTAKPARPNVLHVSTDGAGDVPTLDPGVAEDTTAITMIENTMPGLTNLDEVTNVLGPGMASKWDISADGKQYTFTMREGIPWVKWDGAKRQVVKVQTCPDKDGKTQDRMVTAKDFEYGILRALKPETASPYAYVLDFVIEGAQEFSDGRIADTTKVGVKAVDDKTLVVNFKEPAAYNANIIGLWTARAVPQWLIEGDDCTTARGEKWIEAGFYQSWGPYTVKEWVHDSTLTLIKNPFWPGTKEIPQAKVDEVNFVMLDAVAQLAEFEAGNLDVSNVPVADMDRVKSDAKLSKMLNISPSFCIYYLGFNTQAKVVDDVRVRRALSYAIDRQALIDNVVKGGQEPAQWFARPGLVGAPTMKDHPNLGIKFDVAKAKAELDSYLKEKNTTVDKLDITLMFNTSSGHQKIAEFAQQQWKANLGLSVKLTNQEWKVYLVTTKSKDTPQIFRMGWCLDYPDANNFDREVLASGGSQNPTDAKGTPSGGFMWKDDKFEALVEQAVVEMDPAKRVEMYAQAEQIAMVDDAIMIPMYWYTTVSVTEPWVKRTFSLGGHQIYYKWEILQQ